VLIRHRITKAKASCTRTDFFGHKSIPQTPSQFIFADSLVDQFIK